MGHRAQEAIGIRRQVYSSECRFEIKNGADEGGVLVRETVMLLTRPGRSLNIIERTDWLTPVSLMGLLKRI